MLPRFLVLLGAGASIEAGLPSAIALTEHLVGLASDATSSRIRRIGQVVKTLREEAARQSGTPVADVDFEPAFGALVEAVERSDPIAGGMTAAFLAPHLHGTDLNRLLLDLRLYLRNVFFPSKSLDYLTGLLDTVRRHSGVIASLNYDLTIERWFVERKLPIRVGFENIGWQGFPEAYDGPELLKLHGSVHWARRTLSMNDRDSILSHLIFHSDPFPVGVDHTARWASGELMEGVRPLMNIGVSKEKPLYTGICKGARIHAARRVRRRSAVAF